MNTLRNSSLLKLVIGLVVIALLTGTAYYGVIGVGMTVLPADDWAGAVLNLAMDNHTNQATNYYWDMEQYKDVKDKDIPQWAKERRAEFEKTFNPENTNFRFVVQDEDSNPLFGNYDGEAYIAQSYDWGQRFVGTDVQLQQIEAYERGYRTYDYDNNVYLTTGDNRYPVEDVYGLPLEYKDCRFDELGYLYNNEDQVVARVENYEEVFTPVIDSAVSDDALHPDTFYVDGAGFENERFHTISSDEGFPGEFAYFNDYGKVFDRDFNYLTTFDEYYAGQYDGVVYEEITPRPTPTPRPMPTVSPVITPHVVNQTNAKPIITELNTVMTQEEYEALRDACYDEISVRGYILKEMTVQDTYHDLYMMVLHFDAMKGEYVSNATVLGIFGLILLLVLLVLAGKRNDEGESVHTGMGRLPWDVWLVVVCCLAAGAVCVIVVVANLTMEGLQYGMGQIVMDTEVFRLMVGAWIAAAAVCIATVVGILHSAAAYVKVKGWWRNCLTWKLCVWLWKLCVKCLKWCWKLWLKIWGWCKGLLAGYGGAVKKIPLIWKAAVVLGIIAVVQFMFFAMNTYDGSSVVVALLWNIVLFLLGIIVCLMLKRLQEGARTIADGDLDYRIDTKNLYGDVKEHAECLNRIGEGLSHNVDARLRSERMKTELITNVSHDLKTPLTSIVNYVDLLKKEELTGNAAEYVEVLDRQSARLKKLTEDLVEASKASTGSLQVNVERVSLTEIIEQASAEYALRLQENGLQSIVRVPDEEVTVWADGKYVWRILDNLLSNVCKYAMPNTRVYLEARIEGETAVLSVKNMSRESLNISAEELMERFVRGDSSRTTEGSGLGLSIAQSLAKLMGGDVRLTVDGDLFKAEVVLPLGK